MPHAAEVEIRGPDHRTWWTSIALALALGPALAACQPRPETGTESGNPSAPFVGMAGVGGFGNAMQQPTGTPPTAGTAAAPATPAVQPPSMGPSAGMPPQEMPEEPADAGAGDTDACPDGPLRADEFAAKEPCCYRTSNADRNAELADDESEQLEYRVVHSQVLNHPASLGRPEFGQMRQHGELESLLLRLTLPRTGAGRTDGPGTIEVGFGASLCDGTYAFFGPRAAPADPTGSGRDRWTPLSGFSSVVVDASGAAVVRSDPSYWARRPTRSVPLLDLMTETGAYAELAYQGLALGQLAVDGVPECIGGRDRGQWIAGGEHLMFVPLADNDEAQVPALGGSLCANVAFGLEPSIARCADEARCMPGSDGCPWVKLPDSLCPTTAIDRLIFGCHVGWADNPDDEPSACTTPADAAAAAPGNTDSASSTAVESPTDLRCCDPLGQDVRLPPCNAWHVRTSFVAAAVEIGDEPVSEVLVCGP